MNKDRIQSVSYNHYRKKGPLAPFSNDLLDGTSLERRLLLLSQDMPGSPRERHFGEDFGTPRTPGRKGAFHARTLAPVPTHRHMSTCSEGSQVPRFWSQSDWSSNPEAATCSLSDLGQTSLTPSVSSCLNGDGNGTYLGEQS